MSCPPGALEIPYECAICLEEDNLIKIPCCSNVYVHPGECYAKMFTGKGNTALGHCTACFRRVMTRRTGPPQRFAPTLPPLTPAMRLRISHRKHGRIPPKVRNQKPRGRAKKI